MHLVKHRRPLFDTLKLAWPIAGTQLGAVLMGTIDTVMVGKLGPQSLASMAMSNTLWYFNLVMVFGIISATSPMISSAYGAGKYEKIAPLAKHGIYLALVLSVLTIFTFRMSIPIFHMFKQNPALIEIGSKYLFYFSFGVPAHYCFFSMRMFADSTSDTKPALTFMIVGLLTNAFFNYLLIYGKCGFPALGVAGSGLATSIVAWVMFAGMFFYVNVAKKYKNFRLIKQSWKIDTKIVKTILSIGAPIGAANFSEVSFFMFCTLLIGTLGTLELAAHQIALNLASTTFMVANGVAQATSIQIARSYGKNKFHEIRVHAVNGYILVFLFMIGITVLFLTIPRTLIGVYTENAAVIALAVPLLKIAGGFQILDGMQVLGIAACKGLQDTKIPFLNTVLAFWLCGAPASLVFSKILGLSIRGVWLGMIVGLGLACLLHAVRLFRVLRTRYPLPDTQLVGG